MQPIMAQDNYYASEIEARRTRRTSGSYSSIFRSYPVVNDRVNNLSGQDTPEALLEAIAKRQDKDAFTKLFDMYAPRIKAFLVRSGTSADLAEEICQEAMVTVLRKAHHYSSRKGRAATWIFTIARNLRIDAARRDKRAQLYEMVDEFDQEEPEQPDQIVTRAEQAQRVRAALTELSDEQLAVVKLSFVEGITHSEIAERLNLPLGTVKSRMRLAFGHLRQSLEDLS